MTEGAIVLLAALGMMAGIWRPPGVAAGERHSQEQPPAYGARTNSYTR